MNGMASVGFIGLGNMGGPIASHILAAGHDMTVFDLRDDAMARLVDDGAAAASTPADVAADSAIVFLSLPDPEAVTAVVGELEPAFSNGDLLVDTTTSTPGTTEAIAEELAEQGVDVLGAPVSGGTAGATDATLTSMVGGPADRFEDCESLFECYNADIFHVSEHPGAGHATKLLNNFLSFLAILGTSEAVALGRRAGLDPQTMVDVFSVSSGRNSSTDEKFPDYIIPGEDLGFTLELMHKDIRLLNDFADEKGAPMLLGGVVDTMTHSVRNEFGAEDDMTRAYDYVESTMRDDE